jgi:hypothetical protein
LHRLALRESQMEVADLRKQIEILTDRSKLEQTRIETRLQASSHNYARLSTNPSALGFRWLA